MKCSNVLRRLVSLKHRHGSLINTNTVKVINTKRRSCSSFNGDSGLILGIETSCDDTGAALITTNGEVISQVLSTQNSSRMGGVIPTFAMIFHTEKIQGVVDQCLAEAGVSMSEVSAVAVTNSPGLKGPLIVGTDYAKYLCTKHKKPMIPIHHMEAHALTARLLHPLPFPFLVLLISGGHCLLTFCQDIDHFLLLGTSMDDSPGEALDKISRRLQLHNRPDLRDAAGGLAVEVMAKEGEVGKVDFAVPLRHLRDCGFSFSGLKSQVMSYANHQERTLNLGPDELLPDLSDVCAGVQFTMAKHLCERFQRAVEFVELKELFPEDWEGSKRLVVSGGVASNMYIRESLDHVAAEMGWSCSYPPPELCRDNGVMIAWNGLEKWREGKGIVPWNEVMNVPVISRSPLGESLIQEVEKLEIKCKFMKLPGQEKVGSNLWFEHVRGDKEKKKHRGSFRDERRRVALKLSNNKVENET